MPTPTCTRFQAAKIPCLKCGQSMGLTLIKPGGRPNFELRTYTCVPCASGESFLMAIPSTEPRELSRPPSSAPLT